MVRFPPVWISAIVASLIFIGTQDHEFIELFRIPILLLVKNMTIWMIPLVIGLFFALVTEWQDHKPSRVISTAFVAPESVGEIIRDHNRLLGWLQEERPIQSPMEDVFGFSTMAMRIAGILRGERMRTVGIVGPYGTGKTSLLNLTEYYLQHSEQMPTAGFKGDMILCKVNGWGRIKTSIAERVLTIAIERLAAAVDCSSILSLPASYRRAIGGMRWPGGPVLEALLETSREPVAQISKLDEILTATGLRLVILLEDLDRNTADEIIGDEIPSLLDRLRGMRNISFVLAIGTEHQYSSILIRICDYVEGIV